MDQSIAISWINQNEKSLIELSDKIWDLAEVGLLEIESARLQEEMLAREGFKIESGVAGMPSAFVATWGTGKPVIGFLGEYDALPDLSQKATVTKGVLREGAPGHGCGHNLLGVACVGAAIAAKREMEAKGINGTVKYFGCPAEETLVGKVFMARDGCFKDVDVALTWHPGSVTTLWNSSSLAMNSVRFNFHGRAAHAAGNPDMGRSALDAVELMNIGVNYLREHVIQDARIHYVTTNGGGEPNVVPPRAQVWYYVRAPRRKDVDEIYERILDIAKGACLMTGTTHDVEFLVGCYNMLPNQVLGEVLQKNLRRVGAPEFSASELEFAQRLEESFAPGQKESILRQSKAPEELYNQVLNTTVVEPFDTGRVGAGSTDVGDVSWNTPTAQFSTACMPVGAAGHSWQFVATSGMGIGHKGMIVAAKALALAALDLLNDTSLVEKAQAEFRSATAKEPYKCPVPEDVRPPLHQLKH